MVVVGKWLRRKGQQAERPVVDHVANSTRGQRWGEPGWCPMCGVRGYLDRIDLLDRDLYQHCPACDFHWITNESELRPDQRG